MPVYDVCTLIYQTQEQFKQMDEIADDFHKEYEMLVQEW